jgi:hypothetical protein
MANFDPNSINEFGWIYLAVDLYNPEVCKIGLTKRPRLYDRVTETGNPNYVVVRAYRFPFEVDRLWIERYLHNETQKQSSRIKHFMTGRNSEWFSLSVENVLSTVRFYFAHCLNYTLHEQGKLSESTQYYDVENDQINIDHLIFDPFVDFNHIDNCHIRVNPYIYILFLHRSSKFALPSYKWIDVFTNSYSTDKFLSKMSGRKFGLQRQVFQS